MKNESEVQSNKKKRKRKRRLRGKARAQSIVIIPPEQSATSEPPKSLSSTTKKPTSVTPDKAHQDDVHQSASASSLSPSTNESTWTQVSRRGEDPGCHLVGNLDFLPISVVLSRHHQILALKASLLEVLSSLHLLQQGLDPGQNLKLNF